MPKKARPAARTPRPSKSSPVLFASSGPGSIPITGKYGVTPPKTAPLPWTKKFKANWPGPTRLRARIKGARCCFHFSRVGVPLTLPLYRCIFPLATRYSGKPARKRKRNSPERDPISSGRARAINFPPSPTPNSAKSKGVVRGRAGWGAYAPCTQTDEDSRRLDFAR